MRALPLDFPNDPKVSDLRDEYMFGPAFLVAPVTDQGATSREVYLPAGTDWYNFWTNERVKGGQTITVAAPIDTIPLFVRAGSIIPLGAAGRKHSSTAGDCAGPRLSWRRRQLHALLRRRYDLCL
jgi:alpha-D-xyloside xylohydrolase